MKKSKTMELKKPVRVSLSRQVLTAMESMIRSGKWKVGDRIPAEAELARAFPSATTPSARPFNP